MAAFLGDLLLWLADVWSQILAGLFRRSVRWHWICLAEEGVRLSSDGNSQAEELLPLSGLADRLKGLRVRRGEGSGACALRLENGRALVRRISPVTLPASRLRAAALLDLDSGTPFRLTDAHVLPLCSSSGGSSYAIVKRAILGPAIEACAAAGLAIGRIDIASGDELHRVSADGLREVSGRARSRIWEWAVATLGAVAATGTLAHAAIQYDTSIKQVEELVVSLSKEAKAVRSLMDQRAMRIAEIKGLRKSVEERKLVSAVWEELARVLPDSTFLTDLAIKDSTVSIAGYSAAASSIIVALEGSDMFDRAGFTAPVVKVPGNSGDRFAIDLEMGGK